MENILLLLNSVKHVKWIYLCVLSYVIITYLSLIRRLLPVSCCCMILLIFLFIISLFIENFNIMTISNIMIHFIFSFILRWQKRKNKIRLLGKRLLLSNKKAGFLMLIPRKQFISSLNFNIFSLDSWSWSVKKAVV